MRTLLRFDRWFSASTIVLSGMLLSGCAGGESGGGLLGGGDGGGGGGLFGSGEFGGNPQSLAKYRDTLTSDEAYHLLRRTVFGATPEQVARAVERGLTATIDDMLMERPEQDFVVELADFHDQSVQRRWLVYLLEGANPFRERMAMFWHDRFATSDRVLSGRDRNLGPQHWRMLRDNALGNYREFLQELTIDPLMLIWLDGANSPKDNPNENYTREFWELFTLGRDVLYTEEDIKEGARAFTGITLLRESDLDARPIFDLVNHDETLKTVFPSRTSPENFDYLKIIDLTLEQPEALHYVARNLFSTFVHDNPSDAVVNELGRLLADSDFEIEPVVRRILTSQAMFSSDARGNQISSPTEHIIGVARTLDMHMHSEDSQGFIFDRLSNDLRDGGHELLDPPGVQGWGENEFWLEDQWLISRVRALGRTMEYGPDRTEGLPFHLLPSTKTWDEREVRERIVNDIAEVFHLKLSEEEVEIYVEVLDQNGWRAFHLEEPDRQPQHVFELIRLMAMHEDVIVR